MAELSADNNSEMQFELATGGRTATVWISGELDIANIDELEQAVAPIIERKPERLVVDVSELRFADSSAIALWVRWASTVGQIELREVSPLLRRVIGSMGLEHKLGVVA